MLDAGLKFTGGDILIVPEPGTSTLFGVGLAAGGAAWWARRKCSLPSAPFADGNLAQSDSPTEPSKSRILTSPKRGAESF